MSQAQPQPPSLMDSIPIALGVQHELMRWRLAAGSMFELLRADLPAHLRVRTEAQMDEALEAILDARDPGIDLHIFAYGSLIVEPGYVAAHASVARVWELAPELLHSQPAQGRGSAQEPGATLGLDGAAKVRTELGLLCRREMFAGGYDARGCEPKPKQA